MDAINKKAEDERCGKVVCAKENSFSGLETVAKQCDAKGCFFNRGGRHPHEKDIANFLTDLNEDDFPFGEFSSVQMMVAEPQQPLPSEACNDSDCEDKSCQGPADSTSTANSSTPEQEEEMKADLPKVMGPNEIRMACTELVAELPPSFREEVAHDAEMLANMSTRLCPKATWLTIRIEIAQNYACARWHQDAYISRSIITYVGPGTCVANDTSVQWGEFPKTMGMETNDSCVPSDAIHHMATNAVLLMKGSIWPGIRGEGLTHKAPPVTGEKRLILKVDLHMDRPLLADESDNEEDDGEYSGEEEEDDRGGGSELERSGGDGELKDDTGNGVGDGDNDESSSREKKLEGMGKRPIESNTSPNPSKVAKIK